MSYERSFNPRKRRAEYVLPFDAHDIIRRLEATGLKHGRVSKWLGLAPSALHSFGCKKTVTRKETADRLVELARKVEAVVAYHEERAAMTIGTAQSTFALPYPSQITLFALLASASASRDPAPAAVRGVSGTLPSAFSLTQSLSPEAAPQQGGATAQARPASGEAEALAARPVLPIKSAPPASKVPPFLLYTLPGIDGFSAPKRRRTCALGEDWRTCEHLFDGEKAILAKPADDPLRQSHFAARRAISRRSWAKLRSFPRTEVDPTGAPKGIGKCFRDFQTFRRFMLQLVKASLRVPHKLLAKLGPQMIGDRHD